MGFSRAELERHRDEAIDDLVGPGLRLLIVGINPSLWTVAADAHFSRPGNRFYQALWRSGITDHLIDASAGMSAPDREHLLARGVGITNIVSRATARADELGAEELRAGGARLRRMVARLRPPVVAVAGITAYRKAFEAPKAAAGLQPDGFEGAQLWVVPNPSGLNAHETPESLGAAYREPAAAAGIL